MPPENHTKKIVIAGGSGFLGISLATWLTRAGYSVVILSRKPPTLSGKWQHVAWDARTTGDWCGELSGAAGLVNLAGRSVNCIKTPDHQDEILRSRVESTRVLGHALRNIQQAPPVWVQMSTAHIYGDPPELVCTESSPTGYGLAPYVGKAWEEEFQQSLLPQQRGVVLRTGFVLGRDLGAGGGAFTMFRNLARFGLGGTVGSGRQGMSWIHETDMNRIFEQALINYSMKGMYVASSPHPVSQKEFMRYLRKAMGMPIGLPAFSWMVRFGAKWILRTDPELALYGRYVIPQRLIDEGFTFQYAKLPDAFQELVG
ncbi:MAG: TIGR01777 family oxidoreductase [Planctomycetia bacterium]|nr:TIGR01777 family oxidoreductase [Planctomycetia bacterium]